MIKTAVVTIDYQMDYFPGGRFPLWRAGKAIRRAGAVLAEARRLGICIFHVRHESLASDAAFLARGTSGTSLHPALGVPEDGSEPIILKHTPDAFLNTDLKSMLSSKGVQRVLWMGMISWMCVDTTVRSATANGFENYLVQDACASGWLRHGRFPIFPWTSHRAFMAAIGSHFATLVDAKDTNKLQSILLGN